MKNHLGKPRRRTAPLISGGLSRHAALHRLLGGLVLGCTALFPAAAADTSAAVPALAINQGLKLLKQAAQSVAPPQARIEVSLGAPDSRLTLAPCAMAQAYLGTGTRPWGQTRLGVRCTQGARWNIQLPATVKVWAPALVAQGALPAGAPLLAEQLRLAEVDWGLHGAPAYAEMAAEPTPTLHADIGTLRGRVLARPIEPGAPVRTLDLHARRWFAAGDKVTISAVGDGFSIASEGQALTAGLEGQWVRVRTESGRVVSGKAVAEQRVEIRL